ncbi:MAG: ABC transporter ATP-binding protein [Treponema sp.]|nr:ABC transporter ATP-binding protein [Treponema sp.]
MALLTCTNLTVGYNGIPVITNLSFSIQAGDYLCIIGENGAGKSTLMKTILNLQPPLSGTCTTGDNLKPTEIGYLPQQTTIQRDFPASVKEIVLSGCQSRCGIRPFYSAAEKALALKNIERMGITPLINRCYRELSGGQQQRVLLARALCSTQKLLVLDEPVTGLDPIATTDMYHLIADLNKHDGISIIMISHDIHEVIAYASHILHIGKEVFFGTTDDFKKSHLGSYYLGENHE